jgi:hypothetical protein
MKIALIATRAVRAKQKNKRLRPLQYMYRMSMCDQR